MPIYISSIYYYWTGPFADIGRFINFTCNIYLKIQYLYFHDNLPAPGRQKSTFWHRKHGACASRVAFANMRGVQLSEAKVFTLEDNCGVFPWPDIILLLGNEGDCSLEEANTPYHILQCGNRLEFLNSLVLFPWCLPNRRGTRDIWVSLKM